MTVPTTTGEAEERSYALLRSIVPEEDFHKDAYPPYIQVKTKRHLYQIHLGPVTENIYEVDEHGCRLYRLCGGPFPHNDHLDVERWRRNGIAVVDAVKWQKACAEANARSHTTSLVLPNSDIWLGQYLALKYNEHEFRRKAVRTPFQTCERRRWVAFRSL